VDIFIYFTTSPELFDYIDQRVYWKFHRFILIWEPNALFQKKISGALAILAHILAHPIETCNISFYIIVKRNFEMNNILKMLFEE